MLKDKKYKFARDFNNMSAKTFFGSVFGIPIIAAISTASLITDTTPKYSLDSFSTSDTAVKVEYLEKEMDKINTDFIDSKERLDEIDAIKFAQGSDAVEQLYIEHEQSVEEITADFEEFRYDLFATGISEEAIQDISVTFNNLPVSNNFDLGITPENVIAINDVMKGIDKERHRYTTDLRSDFTGKVQESANSAVKNNYDSFIGNFAIIFLPSVLIILLSTLFFHESKLQKRWVREGPEEKKKKLSPTNPNSSNKL